MFEKAINGRCKNCGKSLKEHYQRSCTEKEAEENEEI